MKIIHKKNNFTKKILFLFILLSIIGFVNSTILVNSVIDKETLSTNEVAHLKINLYNNGEETENYPIRIETTENLIILENEQKALLKNIENLKANMGKEITIKIKALNTKSDTGKIYVYYGNEMQFVSGTFVNTKEQPVIFKTNAEKKIIKGEEKIIINFEIHNYLGSPIYNVGVEAKAPESFIIENAIDVIPVIYDNNSFTKEIEILPPLGINGEQKIILAYGYFDENEAHYFEESFNIQFEKQNNFLLVGIGIIILVIAVFVYMSQKNKPAQDIKGTAEKAKEEK